MAGVKRSVTPFVILSPTPSHGSPPMTSSALLSNEGIIRNRAKILATIENARATMALRAAGEPLSELMRSHVTTLAEGA